MKTPKTLFACTECGYQSSKWLGRCPECLSWNTFEEEAPAPVVPAAGKTGGQAVSVTPPVKLQSLDMPSYMRMKTGMGELDRVLGGGLVSGSVVLISGEPGIGKSTLLLQICRHLGEEKRVLYVSGEESGGQIKMRANRLGLETGQLYLLTETCVEGILESCATLRPDVIIVDSVQTMYTTHSNSYAGSITQVRESAMAYISYAKTNGCAVFLVGHVNKEGGISGPKVLEHMVDAVLYFEGERRQSYRIIRAIKNRFGSTNEIGVFEMGDAGLVEVPNPSEVVLEGRPVNTAGSCAGCVMEGSRPIITEIQALVCQTAFPAPRRTCDGFDYNRMCLLIAVLEKRLGLKFYTQDVYLNIAGGMRMDEPAADLAIALSLISGITDRVVPDRLIAFGEIGLAGEVRAVSHTEYRVKEAVRLGFRQILLPSRSVGKIKVPKDVKLIGVDTVFGALPVLKSREAEQ